MVLPPIVLVLVLVGLPIRKAIVDDDDALDLGILVSEQEELERKIEHDSEDEDEHD